MAEKSQAAFGDDGGPPAFLFAMGELSGQVRSLTQEISQMRQDRAVERKELLLIIEKHDGRIDVLEAWRWRTLGASGVISSLVTFTATYLWGK